MAGDALISVRGGLRNTASEFDASTRPLATKTIGLNFSKSNDFSVPLKADDGTTVYLRPDQIQALRLRANGATSLDPEAPESRISIHVGGQTHRVSTQSLQDQLNALRSAS